MRSGTAALRGDGAATRHLGNADRAGGADDSPGTSARRIVERRRARSLPGAAGGVAGQIRRYRQRLDLAGSTTYPGRVAWREPELAAARGLEIRELATGRLSANAVERRAGRLAGIHVGWRRSGNGPGRRAAKSPAERPAGRL